MKNTIKKILKRKGLKLIPESKELQKRLGINNYRIRRILNNEVVMRPEDIFAFSKELDVSPEELFEEKTLHNLS